MRVPLPRLLPPIPDPIRRWEEARLSEPLPVAFPLIFSSAQAEERKDGHNHHDQSDQIDNAMHGHSPGV
jgi:hypothetical protein